MPKNKDKKKHSLKLKLHKGRKKKNARKQQKKGFFNSGLFKLAAIAAVLGCGVIIITTESDCMDKEKELAALQEQIDAYTLENSELQRTLDSNDLSEYIARIAIEERGYAYPDERRFYDTSRD